MSLIIAIDLSTKPGIAIFDGGKLVHATTIFNDKTVEDFGKYPYNYIEFVEYTINRLFKDVQSKGYKWSSFDSIIIEETTRGRQNYSQKKLEFLHYQLLLTLENQKSKIVYIRDGTWKRIINAKMSKEEKANNAKIQRLKRKTNKRIIRRDEEGNALRKVNRKDVYIRAINNLLGTSFEREQEDSAAACGLALAFIKNAPLCDGTIYGGKINGTSN